MKGKTLWQMEKTLILSNFFFCHNAFQKLSAVKASESGYMWERVNLSHIQILSDTSVVDLTNIS